jgi:hypothetical protein
MSTLRFARQRRTLVRRGTFALVLLVLPLVFRQASR